MDEDVDAGSAWFFLQALSVLCSDLLSVISLRQRSDLSTANVQQCGLSLVHTQQIVLVDDFHPGT